MKTQNTRRLLGGWPTLAAAALLAAGAGAASAGLALAHVGPLAIQSRNASAASGRTQDAPLGDLASPPATPSPDVEVQTVQDPVEASPTAEPSDSSSPEPVESESPEVERTAAPSPSASATPSGERESESPEPGDSPTTSPEPSQSPDN